MSSSLGSSGWSDVRSEHPPPAAVSGLPEPRFDCLLFHFRPVLALDQGKEHCPGRANSVALGVLANSPRRRRVRGVKDWLCEYTQGPGIESAGGGQTSTFSFLTPFGPGHFG